MTGWEETEKESEGTEENNTGSVLPEVLSREKDETSCDPLQFPFRR
jgi:hypothetical protein